VVGAASASWNGYAERGTPLPERLYQYQGHDGYTYRHNDDGSEPTLLRNSKGDGFAGTVNGQKVFKARNGILYFTDKNGNYLEKAPGQSSFKIIKAADGSSKASASLTINGKKEQGTLSKQADGTQVFVTASGKRLLKSNGSWLTPERYKQHQSQNKLAQQLASRDMSQDKIRPMTIVESNPVLHAGSQALKGTKDLIAGVFNANQQPVNALTDINQLAPGATRTGQALGMTMSLMPFLGSPLALSRSINGKDSGLSIGLNAASTVLGLGALGSKLGLLASQAKNLPIISQALTAGSDLLQNAGTVLKPVSQLSNGAKNLPGVSQVLSAGENLLQRAGAALKPLVSGGAKAESYNAPDTVVHAVGNSRKVSAGATAAANTAQSVGKSNVNKTGDVFKLSDIFSSEELKQIEEMRQVQALTPVVKLPADEIVALANRVYGSGAPVKDKVLHLVIGPPGAGKSSVIVEPLAVRYGAMVVDPDHIKPLIPGYELGNAHDAVHEASSEVTAELLLQAIDAGDNIVYPLVGKTLDKLKTLINVAKDKGYQVGLHLVEIPPDEAVRRAFARSLTTDARGINQYVPVNFPLQVGSKPVKNFYQLIEEGLVDEFSHFDNNVPRGSAPRVIMKSPDTIYR
jgi:hypothetical protein